MRSAGSRAAEFAIVVAVVAVRAQNSRAHAPPRGHAVKVQHARPQAGLRKRAGTIMEHRMTGRCGGGEFRNNIQRIGGSRRTYWQITIDGFRKFAGAGAVAAQTIFILVDCRVHHGLAIGCADSRYQGLRWTDGGRGGKGRYPRGRMRIVAINAGNMAVLIQQRALMGNVLAVPGREGMTIFRRERFSKDIGGGGRSIRASIVANDARLIVGGAQQRVHPLGVMGGVARCARISCHGTVISQGCLRLGGGTRFQEGRGGLI